MIWALLADCILQLQLSLFKMVYLAECIFVLVLNFVEMSKVFLDCVWKQVVKR